MDKPLSHFLNDALIKKLKGKIQKNEFPQITFELAMQFILTDGILPESDLPVSSFLKLEDWIHDESVKKMSFTATELKNKTGEILEKVLQGHEVQIVKHGRVIAEIRGL